MTHITRFEYIVTDSELEALVLECNLIKEHRPKYNTMLMDDKSYPFNQSDNRRSISKDYDGKADEERTSQSISALIPV